MCLTDAHGRGSTFRGASQVGAAGDQGGQLATLIAACVWVPTVGADYIDDVDVVRAGGMKALFDGVCALNNWNAVGGVHLWTCPAVGVGARFASGAAGFAAMPLLPWAQQR